MSADSKKTEILIDDSDWIKFKKELESLIIPPSRGDNAK